MSSYVPHNVYTVATRDIHPHICAQKQKSLRALAIVHVAQAAFLMLDSQFKTTTFLPIEQQYYYFRNIYYLHRLILQ